MSSVTPLNCNTNPTIWALSRSCGVKLTREAPYTLVFPRRCGDTLIVYGLPRNCEESADVSVVRVAHAWNRSRKTSDCDHDIADSRLRCDFFSRHFMTNKMPSDRYGGSYQWASIENFLDDALSADDTLVIDGRRATSNAEIRKACLKIKDTISLDWLSTEHEEREDVEEQKPHSDAKVESKEA